MGKESEHHIAQLRHEGTRVVPVFVLALQHHPEDVVLANRCGVCVCVMGGWGWGWGGCKGQLRPWVSTQSR